MWERMRWKLQDIWREIWHIPHNILMICQWVPVLWNNEDYDYFYLLRVISYKTKRIGKYIKKHNRIKDADEIYQQTKEVTDAIDRLTNSHNYIEKEEAEYEEKWGKDISSWEERTEEEKKDALYIYRIDTARIDAEYDRLFDNLKKNIRNWWD